MMNHIPVAIYTCDTMGNISDYNVAAVELLGPCPENNRDLCCGSSMEKVLKDEKSVVEELILDCPNGKNKHLRCHSVPFFDTQGLLFGAINTVIDVTDQRIEERKQAMLAAIVESSEDAIISKTLDGTITSWNQGAKRMFGYLEEEVIGKHISMLIPSGEHFEEDAILENIRRGNRVSHFQTVRRRKDGSLITISLTVSPVKNLQGVIVGASKVARDISREKEAEEKLRQHSIRLELLKEEVKSLNKKKDEFIALASHELKKPLTSISAYLQLLARRQTDGQSKLLMDKAVAQMRKLGSMVSNLLDISKIQSGKLGLRKEVFSLKQLVLDVIDAHALAFEGYKLILEDNPDELYLEADKQRLEQVVVNLLTNAVKYSPNSKLVVITLVKEVGQVSLCVKDYGIGIAWEQQQQMLTKFYRADGLASTMPAIGLGLYISREIIEQHHGKIWVESTYGAGTTVSFSLPIISSD